MRWTLGLALLAGTIGTATIAQPATSSPTAPDHCRWQSAPVGVPHKELLVCETVNGWQDIATPPDFDEHTLKNARAGDPRAMVLMGLFYGFDAPLELRNMDRARYWLRNAIAKRRTDAMVALAVLYDRGSLVPPTPHEAARLDEAAANGGNVLAMFLTAIRYERRIGGTKKSESKAIYWYRKCSEMRDPGCMDALSIHYRAGLGVPRDLAEAERWHQRSQEIIEKRLHHATADGSRIK